MIVQANRREGYDLLHHGSIELARISANGIRIDIKKLETTREELSKKIRDIRGELESDSVWTQWRKRYGGKSNPQSPKQLATIVYSVLGFPVVDRTETGEPSTDAEALQKINHPFVSLLGKMLKYSKALNTFLKGIEKEVVNGRLHPVFNLHTTRTYRSSSDSPNFQNQPVRDKEISKIIRSLFIASSPDHVMVENDFKGIEVGVSACYHKDQNFISYITTPGKDMHRDMAAQIFKLKPEEVSKDARYGAKNKFVFPQFYGDFYVSCAQNIWDWIGRGNLKVQGKDTPLFEHLKSLGITELGECNPEDEPVKGTFEHHVKQVEDDFWNNRFMEYGQWKRDWYKEYLRKGYFDMFTGFRISGMMKRNAVVNYPVQGSAFHCLLWSLIQINRKLRKYKLRSQCVGQIHDSLIGDVRIDELRDYLEIVEHTTTVELRKHYEWLIVPLEIEYEIAPSTGTWFDKQEVKFKKGRFLHPEDQTKWTSDPFAFVQALNRKKTK